MKQVLQLHGVVAQGSGVQSKTPPHRRVAGGPFDLLISDQEEDTFNQDQSSDTLAAAAMAHHHILLGYCADHALLPMQFGAVFSSLSALQNEMMRKAALYHKALKMLADHREYSIVIEADAASHVHNGTARDGRTFLSGKRQMRDQRRELAQNRRRYTLGVHQDLHDLSAQPPIATTLQPDKLLDVSFLVPRARLEELRSLALEGDKRAAALGLRLAIKGPWPAYHFDLEAFEQEILCHGA